MRFEAFETSERADRVRVTGEGLGAVSNDRCSSDEVVHPERRAEAHGTTGGKNMRRPSNVVTGRLGRRSSDEGSPGVRDVLEHFVGIVHLKTQVLGSNRVGGGHHRASIRNQENMTVTLQR